MKMREAIMALALTMAIHATAGLLQSAEAAREPSFAIAAIFPANGARDVCPDTPLRITFAIAPVVGPPVVGPVDTDPIVVGQGKIRIFDAATDAVVDTIDVAVPFRTKAIGGFPNFNYSPVLIDGATATLCLPNNSLAYGKTYYVTIDAGAFQDANGHSFAGWSDARAWRFSTKAALPAADAKRLTVAADGTGDFATVQGAVDFVPAGNSNPVTIFIRSGVYREIVCFAEKHHVTFLGEDRQKTVIAYANSERFSQSLGQNPGPSGAGAARLRGGGVYRRGLFLAHRANNLAIVNLTLHNTTPQGGSQAESLILNGSLAARAILANVDFRSFQDTLQINGQAYISNCLIEGDVDFMWGSGPCFFDGCEARSVRSQGCYTQVRNPAGHHGFVFHRCLFSGGTGVTNNFLSRIEPARFPASEVVLIDCRLTNAVGGGAWQLTGLNGSTGTDSAADLHFWESGSRDLRGDPLDVRPRAAFSRQLASPDDREAIANYSSPAFVLGNEWTPQLAPIILTQPQTISVAAGQKGTLEVAVAAIPPPTYQWRKNGTNLNGDTSPRLEIETAQATDAGEYSVVVTNSAGSTVSAPATIKVVL